MVEEMGWGWREIEGVGMEKPASRSECCLLLVGGYFGLREGSGRIGIHLGSFGGGNSARVRPTASAQTAMQALILSALLYSNLVSLLLFAPCSLLFGHISEATRTKVSMRAARRYFHHPCDWSLGPPRGPTRGPGGQGPRWAIHTACTDYAPHSRHLLGVDLLRNDISGNP